MFAFVKPGCIFAPMNDQLIDHYIELLSEEFHRTKDTWTQQGMLDKASEINRELKNQVLAKAIDEMQSDLNTDLFNSRLNNEAKADGYRLHEASEI